MFEVFCPEFSVCCQRAWNVFRFRDRLYAGFADVLRTLRYQILVFSFICGTILTDSEQIRAESGLKTLRFRA